MAQALILAIGGVLIAVLNLLIGGNLAEWIPWFTQQLLRLATRRLPETQQDRFAEEWTSHVNDVPGDVRKVLFAWGCVSAARDMSSFLTGHKTNLGHFWKSTADLLRALKRSLSDASSELVVSLEDIILAGGIMRTIAVFALMGPLVGFLVSYAFTPKYTSQSLILVEGQKVPEAMVQPVVSDDLQTRIQMLRAVATSDSEMKPVLSSLFPNRSSQQIDGMLDEMRSQPDLVGVPFADLSQITGSDVKKKPEQATSPGFFVSYTASNAREAQQVCEALTSKIIAKNLKFIEDNAKGTVDVINAGLDNAKSQIMAASAKLDAAKKAGHGEEILATIDFDFAKHHYQELLEDKAKADMTANMTSQAQGERMDEIQPASFPDSQDFPVRWLFALGGLCGSVGVGLGLTIWTKLRSRRPGSGQGPQAEHIRSNQKDNSAQAVPEIGTQSENDAAHTSLLSTTHALNTPTDYSSAISSKTQAYVNKIRRKALLGYWMCLSVIVPAGVFISFSLYALLWMGDRSFLAVLVGYSLLLGDALYSAYYFHRKGKHSQPSETQLSDCSAFYRSELERQRELALKALTWPYWVLKILALVMLSISAIDPEWAQAPYIAMIGALIFLTFYVLVIPPLRQRVERRYQRQVDELDFLLKEA